MAKKKHTIEIPAPTAWPFLAAFGLTLAFAGLLTMWIISAAGIVVLAASTVGWFKQCYPSTVEIDVQVESHHIPAKARTTKKPPDQQHPHHRARLPVEIHRIHAGIFAGLAGGAAMAFIAMVGGLISHGSIWYPINVIASTVMHSIPQDQFQSMHWLAIVAALIIHLIFSVGLGLLYGVMLPMMPKRPILLGTIVLPFVWSFFIYASMQLLNPLINTSINWTWFLVAQACFGFVAGLVVDKSERIPTLQYKAFRQRAGIERSDPS